MSSQGNRKLHVLFQVTLIISILDSLSVTSVIRAPVANPIFLNNLFILLECTCFTMCQFLLYSEVESAICIHISPPSHLTPSHLSRSSQSTEFSFPCFIAGPFQLSVLHIVAYICQTQVPNSSHLPLPLLCTHVSFQVCVFIPVL